MIEVVIQSLVPKVSFQDTVQVAHFDSLSVQLEGGVEIYDTYISYQVIEVVS